MPGAPRGSYRVSVTQPQRRHHLHLTERTGLEGSNHLPKIQDCTLECEEMGFDANRWHMPWVVPPTRNHPLVGKVLLCSTHTSISVLQLWCQVQRPQWSRGRDCQALKASWWPALARLTFLGYSLCALYIIRWLPTHPVRPETSVSAFHWWEATERRSGPKHSPAKGCYPLQRVVSPSCPQVELSSKFRLA